MTISVVIVNWNARDHLVRCLQSLHEHPPTGSWEAIVVDNASTDGSAAVVRREAPWAIVIENARNAGLAAANNQGIERALGELVLISNPDVVLTSGAIDGLRSLLERRPRAAFAVPRLLHEDGSVQTSAGDLPTLSSALLGRQILRARAGARQGSAKGAWWDRWSHDEERRVPRGAEACYLVRRRAVEEFGPQDDRFPLDWEGIDWAARANDAGWEVWFTPTAEVIHAGGVSIRQVPLRWVVQSHMGMYRYFSKRRPAIQRPVLAALVITRAVVKMAATTVVAELYDRGHRGARRRPSGST